MQKKILVVEDDKFVANTYRVKLAKAGYETKLVTTGADAVEILNDFIPDLIILDLILPTKDGFTALEEIKSNEKWKKIPVIIASNLGQKEDIDRGMALGADDYIVKSDLTIENLILKIQTLLLRDTTE